MWDLPGPGLQPMSTVLAGGFLTTAPPGKSHICKFLIKAFETSFRIAFLSIWIFVQSTLEFSQFTIRIIKIELPITQNSWDTNWLSSDFTMPYSVWQTLRSSKKAFLKCKVLSIISLFGIIRQHDIDRFSFLKELGDKGGKNSADQFQTNH